MNGRKKMRDFSHFSEYSFVDELSHIIIIIIIIIIIVYLYSVNS